MLGVKSLDMGGTSGIPWGSFSELLLFHMVAADIKAGRLECDCSGGLPRRFVKHHQHGCERVQFYHRLSSDIWVLDLRL